MQIEYEISEQDFVEAQKLALRKGASRSTRLIFKFIPFWGAFICIGVLWPRFQQGFTFDASAAIAIVFGSLLAIGIPLQIKRARKKMYWQTPSLHGTRSLTMDTNGLVFAGPEFSSQLQWKIFVKFVEDDKSFLLYQNQHIFQVIPKSALSPQQISELREAFTQNIGTGT
jgi:hypothetical protein